DAAQLGGERLTRFGIHLDLRDVGKLIFDGVFDGDDVLLVAVDFAHAGVEGGALAGAGGAADEEHAVRLADDAADLIAHLVAYADLHEVGDLLRAVEETHDHLLANDAAGRRHAKVHEIVLHLSGKAAVLRLALLGDIQVAQNLEDIDDGVAHAAAEGVAGHEHAVDAEADAHFLLARLEVDVRGAALARLVDHLQGALVALGILSAGDPRRIFLLLAQAAPEEAHRHFGAAARRLRRQLHPQQLAKNL